MYHDLDEFNKLLGQVEAKSTFTPKSANNESVLDLTSYNMEPVHEGILQNGINRMSNLLSSNLKSKISSEWKHLDEDERKLLLRIIAGNSGSFEDLKGVDIALAQAFKDKTLTATKAEDGTAAIIINRDVDISNSGALKFPQISINGINGELKCNYSSFTTFKGFPQSVKSIEFVKGKSQIEDLSGLPVTSGRNQANYSIDLKYTKINSLKGWNIKGSIKGHVSFRGCGLKDITVDSGIYIAGSLDIRDNPDISIESLKALVLKDYSKNQIVVKGQIYHTLEEDGFYSSKKIKTDEYIQDDLGVLNEAASNRQGVAVSQDELWKIGPEIIKQAEARKLKKDAGSIKDSLTKKVKPEIQSLVSNMASSQLDRNIVSQANQKITSGMSSDEFRKMMKGLFDNLLKQLTELMRNTNGGDSSQVEKSIDTITKVTVDNAAVEMEKFEKLFDSMLEKGGCLDTDVLNKSLDSILNSISPIAASGVNELKTKIALMKQNSSDRIKYGSSVNEFLKTLYIDILGYAKVAPELLTQIVDGCFGEEGEETPQEVNPDSQEAAPEETSAEIPEIKPETPGDAPEATPEDVPEDIPEVKDDTQSEIEQPVQIQKKATPDVEAPSQIDDEDAIEAEKQSKGLARFRAMLDMEGSSKGRSSKSKTTKGSK